MSKQVSVDSANKQVSWGIPLTAVGREDSGESSKIRFERGQFNTGTRKTQRSCHFIALGVESEPSKITWKSVSQLIDNFISK